MSSIGTAIRELRSEQRLTQQELATRADVSLISAYARMGVRIRRITMMPGDVFGLLMNPDLAVTMLIVMGLILFPVAIIRQLLMSPEEREEDKRRVEEAKRITRS